MIIVYLFDSVITGWFSNSSHRYLSTTYCVPGSILLLPIGISELLAYDLSTHWWRNNLHCYRGTLIPYGGRANFLCLFIWGIIITQKLKLFPKHCCVSANIRPLIIWSQLEVSILRGSSNAAAASPDLS